MAQKSARAFEICILPNSALPLPTPSKGFHNFPTLVARLPPPPSPLTIVRSAFCNLQSALYKYAILLLPSAICNLHFAICIFKIIPPFIHTFCNLHFAICIFQNRSLFHSHILFFAICILQSAFCDLHFATITVPRAGPTPAILARERRDESIDESL